MTEVVRLECLSEVSARALQTTMNVETSEEKLAQAFRRQILLVAGYSQEEVDKMDLSSIGDEELQSIVKKRLLGAKADDCPRQKVVCIEDVERYLTEGWEYVANLPNKKVIIRSNE